MLLQGRVVWFSCTIFLMAVLVPAFAQTESAVAGTPAFTKTVKVALKSLPSACRANVSRNKALRSLSAVTQTKVQNLCEAGHKHQEFIRRYTRNAHLKAIWLPHRAFCAQAPGHDKKWAAACYRLRQKLRPHARRLTRVRRAVSQLTVQRLWEGDMAKTASRRGCISYTETHGSSHPYTQQQLGGGDHWGKYQYAPGTWVTAVRYANSYYHLRMPITSRADLASPWEQDVVTAFAVAHIDILHQDPWAECR